MNNNNTTYKDSPLGKIPDDWEVRKLMEITEKIGDGLHGTPEYVSNSNYYFINGNNIKAGSIIINADTKCVSEEEYKKHKKDLKYNALLMSINGTIGSIAFYRNESIVLGKSAAYINCKDENVDFLYYYLQSSFVLNFFEGELTGSTIRNLSLKSIRETPIKLPPLPEQRSIARVLSTMDETISKTNQLIARKELRKKWLMQQLLSGKKRLKGYYSKLIQTKLGKIGSFSKGSGITKNDLLKEGIPCIRYGEIYTTHNTVIKEFTSFISAKTAQISKRIQYGDILFAGSGETAEEIGKCVVSLKKEESYAGGDIIILTPNSNTDSLFLSYILNSESINNQKCSMGKGHSVVHIYPKDLAEIVLHVPFLKEQIAIAQVLQTADKEIQLFKAKAKKLNEQKKGLMQVLLTGKKRLKLE